MNNKPKFRFNSFKDDWRKIKLENVFEQTTNYVNPKLQNIELWSLTVEKGLTPKTERYNRSFLVKKENQFKAVSNGEFIYNPMNMTLGAVDLNNTGNQVAVSGYYVTMKTVGDFDKDYFNVWLKTPLAINLYKSYATGSLIEKQRVQFPTFSLISTVVPGIDEQKKIGSFFKSLDDTISLHQQELEALKQTKQGFLQKMFPQESELVPNIRFPEYKSEWKPIKLSDLTTLFTDGDWIEAKDQSEEGIRLIQTGNIGISKFLNKPGKEKWITEETFKKLKCHEIYAGDILISRLPEPAGRACILPNLETRMITAVDCTIIRVDDNTSSEFLLQYLSTNQYFNMVKSYLGGGTRQRISRSVLGDLIIKVPKELTEQIKIGEFFRQLDEVIELKEKEIEALKETKKGFLQKMFV
ncbi:restriction endonuclease subunit S [Exiguobacterium alkaliphilum]|uniref:restriction endonuclease subunit S n=1 Tax=Exiguobacterium alkaliphilum TaxID=1428684 RepID=UPI00346437BB